MPISLGTTTVTALYLGTTSISSAYLGNTQVFGGSFTPLDLFSGGAQGIWLDPSDLSTMFSDRAGTIPVTTPGTVVGKRLDKSGRGNHAVAPTDAARPIYGVEPKGGRRNLLIWSEGFDNAAWTKGNTAITANADGVADLLYPLTSGTARNISRDLGGVSSAAYTSSIEAKASGLNFLFLYGAQGNSFAYFNLATGAVGTVGSGLTAAISGDLGGGYYRCSVTQTATFNGFYAGGCDANGSTQATASGTNGVLLRNAQLELGSTATAYQRVLSAYDVTESGVDTCHYVQYDGSDDSMSTAAIDFTATDKMSVFAGVRKLGVGGFGTILEISASTSLNNGAFVVLGPNGTTNDYSFVSKGTALSEATVNGYESPISNILTGLGDISGDTSTLRLDGTQVAQATTDQGTGNFGNYPMFFGRRNNATLPFNGRDFGIIIVGKAASAGEITDTETWLAAKTAQVTL